MTNIFIRRCMVFFLVPCIILALTACDTGSSNTGTAVSTTTAPTTTCSAPQHFKIGQQAKVGDTWVVTICCAKWHF